MRPARTPFWIFAAMLGALPLVASQGCLPGEFDSECGEGIPYCGDLRVADLGCPADGRVSCCRWDEPRRDWVVHQLFVTCDGPDAWTPTDAGPDTGYDAPHDADIEPAVDTGPTQDIDPWVDADVGPGPDVGPDLDVTQDPGPDAPPDTPTDVDGDVSDISDVSDSLDVPDAPDVPPLPQELVLDPNSLMFFDLPIGSIRFAVSGHDPVARVCVTLVWDFSNTGREPGPFCDDFGPGFPYAIVFQDTDGPCGEWEYAGTHPVLDAEGCLDMAGFTGTHGQDYANLVVTVGTADAPTRIVVDNRATFEVPPVFLGLAFYGEVPRDAWVQTGDDYGLPTWVQILDPDGPILMFDRCDLPVCGQGGGVCGIAMHRAVNVTGGGTAGRIWLTWDGRRRVQDVDDDCWQRPPLPPGEYTVRFCWGNTVQGGDLGPDVVDPHCAEEAFQLPTERVGMQVSFEG